MELALLALSTIVMPLTYCAMLGCPGKVAVLLAPQLLGLPVLAGLAFWLHRKGESIMGSPVMGGFLALAFIGNVVSICGPRLHWR
jgi:hypothetical protein